MVNRFFSKTFNTLMPIGISRALIFSPLDLSSVDMVWRVKINNLRVVLEQPRVMFMECISTSDPFVPSCYDKQWIVCMWQSNHEHLCAGHIPMSTSVNLNCRGVTLNLYHLGFIAKLKVSLKPLTSRLADTMVYGMCIITLLNVTVDAHLDLMSYFVKPPPFSLVLF